MPLTKTQKQKVVEALKEKIDRQKIMIFTTISGLKVKDLFDLRKALRKTDAHLTVAKKTLIKVALKEKDVEIDPRGLEGEVSLVFGFQDEISPAKIIYQFSQENKNLKILGGYIADQKKEFLDAEGIITLAKLPTKKELEARLVGTIFAPVSNFVNVLQGNLRNLINIITNLSERKPKFS